MLKVRIHLSRIRVDACGYTSNGTYYGIGQKIWHMVGQDEYNDLDHAFRAADLQSARAYVRSACEYQLESQCEVSFVR